MFDINTMLSGITPQINLIGQLFSNIMTIAVIFLPLIVLVVVVAYLFQFKNKIQIRRETKKGKDLILGEYRFRVVRKHGDNERIQIMKGFKIHSSPPEDYFEVQANGKLHLTAYELNGGYLKFVKFDKELIEKKVDGETKKVPKVTLAESCPIDWDFYTTMGEKRKKRYSVGNFWSTLSTIAPTVLLFMSFVFLLSYWSDIQQPNIEREQIALQREKVQLEITQVQAKIMNTITQNMDINTLPDENFSPPTSDFKAVGDP